MSALEEIIINKIRDKGPIPFRDFMEMALYYPELGYYSSPSTTIGREGDFYTSPHLHPIFGAMVARQLIEMWISMGRPHQFHAVEMGAGIGYLCKDILDYLNRPANVPSDMDEIKVFLSALTYTIVEPFSHFRERQQELLAPHSAVQTVWVESLRELTGITGCVLSNELLDAFPVHLIEMNDQLKEIFVSVSGQNIVEEKMDHGSDGIHEFLQEFDISLPPNYRTEINMESKKWLSEVNACLKKGFILTIDYGYSTKEYYSDDRSNGTLLCYHKHQFNENPYQHIGEQDITAHINFSTLKKWGEAMGIGTVGYAPQGTFLAAAGIDEVIVELYADSPDYLSEISKIKGLIMPQGMGASHNIMIQYKGDGAPELRGFSMRNLDRYL